MVSNRKSHIPDNISWDAPLRSKVEVHSRIQGWPRGREPRARLRLSETISGSTQSLESPIALVPARCAAHRARSGAGITGDAAAAPLRLCMRNEPTSRSKQSGKKIRASTIISAGPTGLLPCPKQPQLIVRPRWCAENMA